MITPKSKLRIFGFSRKTNHRSNCSRFVVFTSPWRRSQQGRPKRWYPAAALHRVTTQKTSVCFVEQVNRCDHLQITEFRR